MNIQQFLQGCIIGFSVGTTIGVSGMLCLQNMMTRQISLGIASVFAIALADMSCAALLVFGLSFIQSFLTEYTTILGIIAGILLIILGLKRLMSKIKLSSQHEPSSHIYAAFASVYFLSMIDPVTILDFMTLYLGLTINFSKISQEVEFVLGVFLGSLSWWFLVYGLVVFLEKEVTTSLFQKIQYVIGAGIFLLGLWTLGSNLI